MDSFPCDFNADQIFPLPSKNPELANIRQCIVACVKRGPTMSTMKDGNVISLKQAVRIEYQTLYRLGMTFRHLTIIDQELINLGFIVQYEIYQPYKKIVFEEIDPFGRMPDAIIIGSKNDYEHVIQPLNSGSLKFFNYIRHMYNSNIFREHMRLLDVFRHVYIQAIIF